MIENAVTRSASRLVILGMRRVRTALVAYPFIDRVKFVVGPLTRRLSAIDAFPFASWTMLRVDTLMRRNVADIGALPFRVLGASPEIAARFGDRRIAISRPSLPMSFAPSTGAARPFTTFDRANPHDSILPAGSVV